MSSKEKIIVSDSSQQKSDYGIIRDNEVITFIPMNIVAEISDAIEKGKRSLDGGVDSLWNNLYDKYSFTTTEFDQYIKILNDKIENTSGKINERVKTIEKISIDNIDGIINYLDAILDSLRKTSALEVKGRNYSQSIQKSMRTLKDKGGIGNDFNIFEKDIEAVEVSTTGVDKLDRQEEIAIKTLSDKLDNGDIKLDNAFNLLCSSINYFSSYGETLTSRTRPLIVSFRSYFQKQKDEDSIDSLEY